MVYGGGAPKGGKGEMGGRKVWRGGGKRGGNMRGDWQ